MIKSTFGIKHEPFNRPNDTLLEQQQSIIDIIKIHAQQGGFSVIIGEPGVGKTTIKNHIESLANDRDVSVVSFSRTMHTYMNILKQVAESFRLDVKNNKLESDIIKSAYNLIKDRKTLYILIDEAHLLDMSVLRKLRLLFERFPKKHNLILFGQRDLLYYLSMTVNEDIKSRITFSQTLYPLNDEQMRAFILSELDAVGLGHNTINEAALELIIRSSQGKLRLCRNLCYGSLVQACMDSERVVTNKHVNAVLVQPHWRTHEELIKQQVSKT